MNITLFIKGILIALVIAVPLGPMAIICIRRSLRDGFWAGFFTTLGITAGDTVFAIIAGFSLTFIMDKIHQYERCMGIAGSLMLFGLGIYVLLSKVKLSNYTPKPQTLFKHFLSSFILTLTNPLTPVALISLFSWFGATRDETITDIIILICGLAAGVMGWFTLVNALINIFKAKLNENNLKIINKIMGILLIATSLGMLWKMIFR